MQIPYGKIGSLLMVLGIVGLVGMQLGLWEKRRPASPEAAILAARGFVTTAVRNRGGHNGPLPVEVVFPEFSYTPTGKTTAVPDAIDTDLWTVTGTVMVRQSIRQWTVKERWDGVRRWIPKAVKVWESKGRG